MAPGNQSLLQKLIELCSTGIIALFGGGVEAPAFAIGAVFNCLAENLTRQAQVKVGNARFRYPLYVR